MASKSQKFAQNQMTRFNPDQVQTAVVMDNRDPKKTGRLKVWISGSQSDQTEKGSWLTVRYASPFAGRSPGQANATSFSNQTKSYGFWAVSPDVGTTVLVFFANGNIHDGYWFGCVYDDQMNSMVPGPSTAKLDKYGSDAEIPLVDYDRNTVSADQVEKYINVPLVEGLRKQNLLYDPELGVVNRSSTRQITSTVYGMSTPRGQSIVLDDGYTDEELKGQSWDDDTDGYQNTQFGNMSGDTRVGQRKAEGIVFRTRSGAQILLSEDKGNVFIINRDGTARLEMTPDGHIIIHGDKSFSVRAGEDINFSAGRDINMEAVGKLNMNIGGDTKLNLVGKLDAIIGGQTVINAGADMRVLAKSTLRLQGSEVHSTSSGITSITSGGVLNLKGTSVHMDGGSLLTISGSGINSNNAFKGTDFQAPGIGLVGHIHNHASFSDPTSHSDAMKPGTGGGSGASTSAASTAQPANDVAPEAPEQTEQVAVQKVVPTAEVQQPLDQDLEPEGDNPTYTTSYEGLQMVMPCNGTIRNNGFWGKDVPNDSGGKTTRYGWIIQCNGNVVSPEQGVVAKTPSGGVVIVHNNGLKSVFYDLESNLQAGQMLQKGSTVGTAKNTFTFEIRSKNANLFGFAGTFDPGLFYQTVTGTGSACSGKSLTAGQPSNPQAPKTTTVSAGDSSELVLTANASSIGSMYPQRGSRRNPRRVVYRRNGGQAGASEPIEEDMGSIDKTAKDWVIEPTDPKLVAEIKKFEGTAAYQERVTRSYRNNRFYVYSDSRGFPTIGYGHLVVSGENFSAGLSDEEAEQLLTRDLAHHVAAAKKVYAQYGLHVPYMAQLVMCEMAFQLGSGGLAKFKGMLGCLKNNDYPGAANHIRTSDWYKQTTSRAEIMAKRLEACA